MRTRAATAAGLLGLATAVHATGSAIINNNCGHDVYLWPVSVDESPSSATVIKANGGSWNQPYKTCSSGGMSLKLADSNNLAGGITQFEYTLTADFIWYDISNVNCLPFGDGDCPFASTGMFLQSGSGCPTATCEAGNATCHEAYTYPKDDWASLACEPSADTTLDLCGSSSGSSSSSSGSDGIIGQLTSAVGSLLGGGDSSSTEASSTTKPTTTAEPTTSTTPTPTPTPTPTTSSTSTSTTSTPTSTHAKPSHHWSPPVAVSEDGNGVVAAAAAASTSVSASAAPPTTEEIPTPTSSVVATTLAIVAVTTQAPENPNVAVVYETVTTMVSTTVIYQHKMFHKEKRGAAHPHARRHNHEE